MTGAGDGALVTAGAGETGSVLGVSCVGEVIC